MTENGSLFEIAYFEQNPMNWCNFSIEFASVTLSW